MKISDKFCKFFIEFYNRFPCGGFLHVVMDDGNWETKHIVWALMHWKEYSDEQEIKWLEEHEKDIIEMCSFMLDLTEKQRYKIWNEVDKFLVN